jgi:hypothetical protein
MGTNDGGIEHHVLIVPVFRQRLKDTFENTAFAPPAQSLVGRLPIAEPLGKIAPGNPRTIAIQNRFDKAGLAGGRRVDTVFRDAVDEKLNLFKVAETLVFVPGNSLEKADDLLGLGFAYPLAPPRRRCAKSDLAARLRPLAGARGRRPLALLRSSASHGSLG